MNQPAAHSAMSHKVVTVQESDPLPLAFEKMHLSRFRHLPVVNKDGEVVGMLSERDLERAMSTDPLLIQNRSANAKFESRTCVADFMTMKIQTINSKANLKEAALIMNSEKISSLLVVNDRWEMVGIITTEDLLKVLIGLLNGKPTVIDEFKSLIYTSPIGAVADFLNQTGI